MQLNDLVPELNLMIPQAAPAQLQRALLESIKDFMAETQVFTDRCNLQLQNGVPEYQMLIAKCQSVVSIRGVMIDGMWIRSWARDGHEDVVILGSDYDDGSCAIVEYAWKIRDEDCDIPDKIKTDYWWTVTNGALRRLHRMFGSTIVSAGRAQDADSQWEAGIANVKSRRVMQFSNSRPRMHRSRSNSGRFRL